MFAFWKLYSVLSDTVLNQGTSERFVLRHPCEVRGVPIGPRSPTRACASPGVSRRSGAVQADVAIKPNVLCGHGLMSHLHRLPLIPD